MQPNVALVTRWFTADDKEDLLRTLNKGDLLEFKREAYRHWAVCVAVGTDPIVVHRTGDLDSGWLFTSSSSGGDGNIFSSSRAVSNCRRRRDRLLGAIFKKSSSEPTAIGRIAADLLWEVLAKNGVRINNSRDVRHPPRTVAEIVSTALTAINSDAHGCYNLLKNNCEHFAKYCRYGESVSDQAVNAILAAALSMAFTTGMILLKVVLRLR